MEPVPIYRQGEVLLNLAIPTRPSRIQVDNVTARTSEELEAEMHRVIGRAEAARRAIARAVQARGGQFDFDITVERLEIEAQVRGLKQIQELAAKWMTENELHKVGKAEEWLARLESAAGVTSVVSSIFDVLLGGSLLDTVCAGVSSGIQGGSSLVNKCFGWRKAKREAENERLLDIRKRSLRMSADLESALEEYRENAVPREACHVLSPRELWAGALCYLMMTNKKKQKEGGVSHLPAAEAEMKYAESGSIMRGTSSGSLSGDSLPMEVMPIPDISYIGPRVQDWEEAVQGAMGAGRAIRLAALRERRKRRGDDKGYEAVAFELYRQIKILDHVIQKAEATYQDPKESCVIAGQNLAIKSSMISENICWFINWGALASVFLAGYSPAAIAVKLTANVGQGVASYLGGAMIGAALEQIKEMSRVKNLVREAKRERESFYLSLLSYYPHFDEVEEIAMSLRVRARLLEAKMDRMLNASSGDIMEDFNDIALRLLARERDKGVDIQALPFRSSKIAGLLLSNMRDYAIQFPRRNSSELVMGRGSFISHMSSGETPPSPPFLRLPRPMPPSSPILIKMATI